ncbi:MAG: AAA family ATPase [Candidatus Hodarchaeales archaeon]
MTDDQLFIEKISLTNFMAHQSTLINIHKPILLISGANGAGKSQIIEALQLAFGELSTRAKKLGIASLIHPEAEPKRAVIEVTVSNPKYNGRRMLDTEIPAIKPLLENSVVTFKTTISPSKITRFVGSENVFREILQRDLRRVLNPLGIRPSNQLTFTVAETVEVFSQESPYRKFQVLLENLGLSDLKEQIVSNEKMLDETVRETTRLQEKLQAEKNNLELFKSMFEYIQQRSKLEAQEEELALERKWVDIYQKEDKKSELEIDINKNQELNSKLLHEIETINKKIREKNSLRDKTGLEVGNLTLEIRNFDKDRESDKDKRSTLKGRLTELKSLLEERKRSFNEMTFVLKNKSSLKEFQDDLTKLESNLEVNKKNIDILNSDLQNLEEEQKKEDEKISKYEQDIIHQSLELKQALQSEGLSSVVLGPIIEKIRIKEDQLQWESAIKPLIGDYLFSFVSLTSEAFDKTKQLYDSLFVDQKPAFHVFLFSPIERKKIQLDERIYNFTPNLLEGSPELLLTLKNVMNSGVAEQNKATELAEAARKSRLFILTKSGEDYYTPAGSFTRPPKQIKSSLGFELVEPKKPKEIRAQRKKMLTEIAQSQKEQQNLVKSRGELRSKINLFSSNDQQLINKKLDLEQEVLDIESQIKNLSQKELDLSKYVENSDKKIKDFREQITKQENLISELSGEVKVLENEIKNLDKKKNEFELKIKELSTSLEPLLKETSDKIKELLSYGPRPDPRREKEYVDNELTEVRTKLSMIKNKSIGMDKLSHQETLVEELKDSFEERRKHLEQLREDLQKRKDNWDKIIKPFFLLLNDQIQELSKEIFYQTRVYIEPEDLDRAGLVLQAVTKDEWRSDTALSSGEKVMLMECMILALHGLSNSPIHTIDEFTQRLDLKNKNKVFRIVQKLMDTLSNEKNEPTQFILITQDAFGIDLVNVQHIIFANAKMISN